MHFQEFYNNDYYIFALYQVKKDGACACEYSDCQNVGKHPLMSGWQHPIKWDEEQLKNSVIAGQYKTGYGVLMNGLFVIDIDAKNGGVKSFQRLINDFPELAECGFIVDTGSGGGSQHWYFKIDHKPALQQTHRDYPGIDFKSTGFVVGPGSLHKSGRKYEIFSGSISTISTVPQSILNLLEKPSTYRVEEDGKYVDVTEEEVKELLFAIKNDKDYDDWITIGMALHSSLEGEGFELFNEWSALSEKYDEGLTFRKWRSFSADGGYTFATLKWHAMQCGWTEKVQIEYKPIWSIEEKYDLHKPPGFVGELTDWINDQCAEPREKLAVGAALTAMGSLGGLYHKDMRARPSTSNLFTLSVASSASGKNSVVQAFNKIMDTAGLISVTYGKSKSSRELYKNLIEEQISIYNIDEIGIQLGKIANARKSGASYYESWFGDMMSLYSNADGIVNLGGDEIREVRQTIKAKIQAIEEAMKENEMTVEVAEPLLEILNKRYDTPSLVNPFVSLIGYSTPETMEPVVTPERVREGFLGRSLLCWEPVDLPQEKPGFSKREMSMGMQLRLKGIAKGGTIDNNPLENYRDRIPVKTTPETEKVIQTLSRHFFKIAEQYQEENGMHAAPKRAMELVLKISYILAIPDRVRTPEHVSWAAAFVEDDIKRKVALAVGNSDRGDALVNKIMGLTQGHKEGLSLGVLKNRCRSFKIKDIEKCLEYLLENRHIQKVEAVHPVNGKVIDKYKSV